jgi:hypothetical protein
VVEHAACGACGIQLARTAGGEGGRRSNSLIQRAPALELGDLLARIALWR